MDTFDPDVMAQARFERDQQLKITQEGFGSTKGAEALIHKYVDQAVTKVTEGLQDLKKSRTNALKELYVHIGTLNPATLAVVGLHHMLTSIGRCHSLGMTTLFVGRGIEFEAFAFTFRSADDKAAARVEAFVKRKHSSLKHRRTALRAIANKQGRATTRWPNSLALTAGSWLMELLLEVPLFVLVMSQGHGKAAHVTLTAEAFEYQEAFVRRLIKDHPVFAPIKVRPQPWTSVKGTIVTHGRTFGVRLMRTRNRKIVDAVVQKAIADGKMPDVLESLNSAQDTPWAINRPIADMVRWAYETGVKVEGLPSKDDVEPPAKVKPWDNMTDDERLAWRKSAETVKKLNRALEAQRSVIMTDLATADYLGTEAFWTPMNLDYRGRVYSVCHFSFQRADYVRGMFQFAEGRRLGDTGLYWLKVHLANCGDFGKVSKASFDDRVAWVDENLDKLYEVATDPKDCLWWTKADSPFLFLAACIDVCRAMVHSDPSQYVSHIPVSFDGSCSGLQHLCAMTKAPEGILVNLGVTDKTNDIYQVVADRTKAHLEAEGDPEKQPMARMALDFGVTRSFVKRQVMTYAYSSPIGGMREQIKQDYMIPLQYKVLSGELAEHPFGTEWHVVAQYLATVIYRTIEEVVHYPAQAMKFLQRIASTMSHEGKPLIWHTPLGLPVVLKYPKSDEVRHHLYLSDTKFSVTLMTDQPGIDKSSMRNAVAPSFVHSYDACHLMETVLEAKNTGITDVALVHDSFGCHAGVAQDFRRAIINSFVWLYETSDPLADALRDAHDQIDTNGHRLPEAISYGDLKIEDISNAEYAFA